MSLKIFSLMTAFVLSVFLLTSMVSATQLTITNIVGDSGTANSNDGSFTMTFDVENVGTADTAVTYTSNTQITSGTATITIPSDFPIADGTSGTVTVSQSVTVNFATSYTGVIAGTIEIDDFGSGSPKSFTFSITVTDITAPVITLNGASEVNLRLGEVYTELEATATDNVDGPLVVTVGGDVVDTNASGTYIVTYNADNDSPNNPTLEVTRTVNVIDFFCNEGDLEFNGAQNDSQLTLNVDINNKGEGEDEEWLPLDTIEIEVELENDKTIDLDNVKFELALYKEGSAKNIIDDMMWVSKDNEEIKVGDIKDGKQKAHTFEFRVDPSEVEDGNYILKVKAYEDKKETRTCIDHSTDLNSFGVSEFSANLKVITEDDEEKMVVVDTESLPKPINAFCSGEVEFTADIYNIGDQDFPDQILVNLYNTELGIDLDKVLDGDLDAGERVRALFFFEVPADAEEKQYTLKMRVFYDYDEDDNEYQVVSDETFDAFIKVEGNCVVPEVEVNTTDTTVLDSDDKQSKGFFSSITGSVVGMGDSDGWYLWVIGAVNVILVFSIIFVAVRMLRRS